MDKVMKDIKEGKGLKHLGGYQPTETPGIACEGKIASNGNVAQKEDNPMLRVHSTSIPMKHDFDHSIYTAMVNNFIGNTNNKKNIVLRLYEGNVPTDKFIVRNLYIPDGDWRIEGELDE